MYKRRKDKEWMGVMFEKGRIEHINPQVSRARALKLELGCKAALQEGEDDYENAY